MSALETDVLVVGAGPGGYVAAIKLSKLGKKVVLADKDRLGGECLHYGCIPSKALIHAASLAYKARTAQAVGLSAEPSLDWAKLQAWRTGLLAGLERGIAGLLRAGAVTVLKGTARLTSAGSAEIVSQGAAQTVRFASAILAAGTRPIALPGLAFDGELVISSKEALELSAPPARLAVIGGGVIGLEIGTYLAKLGSKVCVVEMTAQLLPGVDPDLVGPVQRKLERLGVEVFVSAKAQGLQRGAGPAGSAILRVETPSGTRELAADKVLVSVGRAPATRELGLEAAGIKTDPKGHVLVDACGRTSAGSIYAIGDMTGPPYLAHKASKEGLRAALAIAGRAPGGPAAIPSAIFTDPEIAFVGESESQARARGAEVLVGRFPFSASGRAQAAREADGFIKVVAEASSHRLLGAGIVGPSASDLIGEACLAVRLGARLEDVADTVHPHPTLPEAFQEACEAALGEAIHILQTAR